MKSPEICRTSVSKSVRGDEAWRETLGFIPIESSFGAFFG